MLTGILRYISEKVKPEVVPRCAGCQGEIVGKPYEFGGKPHCSYWCIPAVLRVHRAEVKREQAHREADQLAIARKAGL